ncbi:hypothetical protein VitviT2T_013656 [Vitis vinifera]|uniref:Uncharacterized protein n=1 Tax=Vitis vinifera TaxID=29760 RepID=A0ABY9CIA7_VITVI|nr:hypothetical protein VitviT2T_013656 [Vitis vinifera]
MGFRCPERKGVADYLHEVTSRKDRSSIGHVKTNLTDLLKPKNSRGIPVIPRWAKTSRRACNSIQQDQKPSSCFDNQKVWCFK